MNKHILKTAAAMLTVLFSASLMAQLTLKEEPVNGHVLYRLENARLSLLIDPNAGGTIVSCKDRLGGNVELVPDKEPRGIAIDHFQSQPFPGEMYSAVYKVSEVKAGADRASITLQYNVTGTFRAATDEKLKDLLLEKTFSLSKDCPALQCKVRITAPKSSSTLFAYWQQSILFAGGTYDRAAPSFRPSTRGIRVKTADSNGHTGPEAFIRDFTAGWMALIDTKSKTGMAILSNYDDLDVLYMCLNVTMESMYRQVFLPAGKSMEYVSWFIPVAGLDNVVSVTPDYIAGYTLKGNGKTGGEITFSAIRSINEPAALNLKVKMFSTLAPDATKEIGRLEFPKLGTEPLTRSIAFPPVGPDPLVMQAQADAGDKSYNFEEYCNGTYQWGENIQTDMISPVYQGKRPAQKINLSKPEKLQLRNIWGDQIWYVEGLMDDYYQLSKVIDAAYQYNTSTLRDQNFISYGVTWRSRLDGFPWDYDKLLSYDLIILGGAKREALGDTAMEMLQDYLQAGGSMLVLGGPMAYGNSRLDGTALADCLPVTFGNQPFGLECLNNPEIKVAAQAPFLENLDWKAAPRVKYLHKVEVKPWGRVILQVDGKPFLVVGEKGKQRIACILGAPMGSMEQGQLPFWQWNDWNYLMQQLCWWLMKEDYRFTQKSQ